MEVAEQEVGQKQMTDVLSSLATSHEALCLLSLCQTTPVLGATGQGWAGFGESVRPPQNIQPPFRGVWMGQLPGGAAGVCPWSPTAVCVLIPVPWSPPGWQVGWLRRKEATGEGWGAEAPPQAPQLPTGSCHMRRTHHQAPISSSPSAQSCFSFSPYREA